MEEIKVIKFFNGTASTEEEAEIFQWLQIPESKKEFDAIIEKCLEAADPTIAKDIHYDRLLDKIHWKINATKINPKRHILPVVYQSLKIASGIVLCLFLGYVMLYSINYRDNLNKPNLAATEISTTVRTTGPGEKLTLLMPDKTKITVNALSEISFTSDYGKIERIVTIKGEAFFDVASDPSKPFQVLSNGITTTALGTEFNVFNRDAGIRVALVEGKVAVTHLNQSIELDPGLMASLSANSDPSQDFLVQKFDQDRTLAWKQGTLIFDRKSLKAILKDLEEWYGVTIQVEEGIDLNNRLIGSYTNKNLEDILTGLSFSLDFDFAIHGKNVQLNSKKQ